MTRFINKNLFFVTLLFLLFGKICFAGDLITGSFDSSSPVWDRIKDSDSTQSADCDAIALDSWNNEMQYHSFDVISTVDENFTATVVGGETNVATVLALYCKQFNPDRPDNTLVAINDDGAGYPHPKIEGIALKADTVYTIVITKYSGFKPDGEFQIQLGGNFTTNLDGPTQTTTPKPTPKPTPTDTPDLVVPATSTPEPDSEPTPKITTTPDDTEDDDEVVETSPISDFIIDQTTGPVPLDVNFSDLSKNKPTSWLWDFGDGSASIDQNPSHTYFVEGFYSVTLTVVNVSGEDTITKDDIINALPSATTGKSFTFKCDRVIQIGAASLEWLILELGETETCLIKLTNLEPGKPIEISAFTMKGLRSSTRISPSKGIPDATGELEVTINAVRKGIDWVAWAVPNEDGEFEFSKRAYDSGLAWGMFVEIK